MSTYDKVRRDIDKAKEKLDGQIVYENFGQSDIRRLNEKYNNSFVLDELNANEREDVLDALDSFAVWCASYC